MNKINSDDHYGFSPYRYIPESSTKLISNQSIDLGEGILRLFYSYDKKNKILKFRKKFVKSKTIGGWLQLSDPNSARLISNSNYLDWLCLDMEHGLINNSNIPNILNAVESSGKFIFAHSIFRNIEYFKIIRFRH